MLPILPKYLGGTRYTQQYYDDRITTVLKPILKSSFNVQY